jgi:gluconolactonase
VRFGLLLLASLAAAQDFNNLTVERIHGGLRFADGPAWSAEGLLFADTVANKVYFWNGKGPAQPSDKPAGAIGNFFDSSGRLYSCEFRERRVTRADKKGRVETLADKFEGKRLNAPNDITVRHDGHAWFTDPAFGSQQDRRELDFFGIFHLTPKGELEAAARWKTRPNGITLSPNGRTLYVVDSDERSVHAFDVDRGGAVSHDRVLISSIEGVPNGIRTDEKGNLYVAARTLLVFAPDGKPLGKVDLAETPSNLAFGDSDLSSLYVTARTSVYRVRLSVKGASN